MMMVGKRVTYSGRVQGVGFRYTTRGIAAEFPVSGYVRNLPHGDVELVAEGAAEQVEAFFQAVAARLADYIAGIVVEDVAPSGYHDFSIRP